MKVGIVGAGTIVPSFLEGSKRIDDIEVKAICGLDVDLDKMKSLALEYNISQIYLNYDEMLQNEDIDFIYVAVPNHLHFHITKKALLNHKNVILEKPFVVYKQEAEELAEIAKRNHLFLFEAITLMYNPNYLELKKIIPELGNIKIVQFNYSQYSRRYDQFKQGNILPAFDYTKAGGALMDLNIYNLHFVIELFGKPENVIYYANIEKNIDTSGTIILEYDSFKCILTAAKDSRGPVSISLQGDKGYIYSNSPTNIFTRFNTKIYGGIENEYALHDMSDNFYRELFAFNEMFKSKDYKQMRKRLDHTIDVIEIAEKARKSANLLF